MPRRPLLLALAAALACSAACSPCCGDTSAGDLTGTLEFEPLALTRDRAFAAIEDGALLPMVFGGQGLQMLVVGARARNVDGCGVKVTGEVYPAGSRQLILTATSTQYLSRVDELTAQTTSDDGALQLVVCNSLPESCETTRVDLELTLTDSTGRKSQAKRSGIAQCERYRPCDGGTDGGG
jgi:hypothetical protein